jgi:hypothetical protein
MPARSSRFGFTAGALTRALVVVVIALAVATAVASVETRSFQSEAVHHAEVRIQATAPIVRWSVQQKGQEIAPIDSAEGYWYGVVHQENGPIHIQAQPKGSGPLALRVDTGSAGKHLEQLFWGNDLVSATVSLNGPVANHEHHHD